MGMGFGLTGLLLMFLFLVGVIALAIWLVSALFPRGARPAPPAEQDCGGAFYESLEQRRPGRGRSDGVQQSFLRHRPGEEQRHRRLRGVGRQGDRCGVPRARSQHDVEPEVRHDGRLRHGDDGWWLWLWQHNERWPGLRRDDGRHDWARLFAGHAR